MNAEAAASGAPRKPEITTLDRYSLVTNDPEATKRVSNAFRLHFSSERVQETKPTTASEDFGSFGAEWGVPSVFWFVGGIDSDMYEKAKKDGRIAQIPTNHNPRFAPVIHPTCRQAWRRWWLPLKPGYQDDDAWSVRPRCRYLA